jgi:protein-S-isoprenylcysteine O-methyltransferase Ste14
VLRAFQWLGGALFAIALAVFAWWYVVALDETRPGGGPIAVWINLALFSMFAAHHSVFARASVKQAMRRLLPDEVVRSLYVWTAAWLLLIVCLLWRPVGGELYRGSGWTAVALGAVQIAGVLLVASAVRVIDPLELAGIRPSPRVPSLRIVGPYRWVRHPIYLGWILATFGAVRMTGDRLLFSTAAALYLAVGVVFEERSLRATFGDEYARYQESVRWRIVPFVY